MADKMMVVETGVIKIPYDDTETWKLLGSAPRIGGEKAGGKYVPEGKTWLFPLGCNEQYARKLIEKFGGQIRVFWV